MRTVVGLAPGYATRLSFEESLGIQTTGATSDGYLSSKAKTFVGGSSGTLGGETRWSTRSKLPAGKLLFDMGQIRASYRRLERPPSGRKALTGFGDTGVTPVGAIISNPNRHALRCDHRPRLGRFRCLFGSWLEPRGHAAIVCCAATSGGM